MVFARLAALTALLATTAACTKAADTADTSTPPADTDTDTNTDADTDTDADTGAPDGACPDFMPADHVGIRWVFETERSDGTITWTQEVLPQSDGKFVLATDIEGAQSNLFYTCGPDQMVEVHGGDSEADGFTTLFDYAPPMMMWPGGTPKKGMTWLSLGDQSGTWSGGGYSGSFDGSYSSQWWLTGINLTYDLDGTELSDCMSYTREATTSQPGVTITTDELGIYCGSLYGLVWTDVVTTTDYGAGAPAVAETVTRLISASFP